MTWYDAFCVVFAVACGMALGVMAVALGLLWGVR